MIRRTLCIALFLATLAAGQTRRVVAISHRGEHLHHPENTVPAFEEAIRVGADFIEVDVQTTADGKLVLSHDGTVNRCTNGQGKVSEMTFEQIEALDAGIKTSPEFAGTRIPTFDQVLDLARGKIGIYVDVKNASARDLVSHIDGHGMTVQVVIYCTLPLAKQIQELNPRLKVMPESSSVEHSRLLIEQLHPKVIAFGAGDFKPEIIAVAKAGHRRVYVDRMGTPTRRKAGNRPSTRVPTASRATGRVRWSSTFAGRVTSKLLVVACRPSTPR